MENKTYEITTSHFCFYVRDVHANEVVGFYRSLEKALKAYPSANVNVPVFVKKSHGIS
jgi:hypothetical protein